MTAADASLHRPRRAFGIAACLLVLWTGLGCGPREEQRSLVRRPLAPKSEDGWTRLILDPASQLAPGDLWIGDDSGKSLPFLRERSGLWGPRQLDVDKLLLGTDAEGRPSAEFSLRLPPGWNIRDREHLRIDLDLQGKPPWVCRVDVARRMEGPTLFGLPRESPIQLQNLDGKEAIANFLVPWDSRDYRVVLQALSGPAPTIRSLKVTAVTEAAALDPDRVLTPAELLCEIPAPAPERWRLRLAATERVVGLEVQLKAPSGPVRPVAVLPPADTVPGEPPRVLRSADLAWNLPPRGGRGSRILFDPVLTNRLILALPTGARLESVKVLARDEEILFPVQAGRRYWLHLGGKAKPAGEPGLLPPSRLIYGRDPIRMGSPEPDPQGLPRAVPRARKDWQRWSALGGAAVLALAAAVLLFRQREA